jgi:prepilin-type N-terminal cleavage/methylation domain-containing protein
LQTGSEHRTGRRAAGFTLLELILVLLVVSLVMAVTYPSLLRGRTAFRLRAAGRDVIAAMRYARETAVTEQKVMMLQIDNETRLVTVSDDVGDGARSFSPPPDVTLQWESKEAEARPAPLKIRFLPNGSSDGAQILLKADTGAVLKIVTDPVTGSARIASDAEVKAP